MYLEKNDIKRGWKVNGILSSEINKLINLKYIGIV